MRWLRFIEASEAPIRFHLLREGLSLGSAITNHIRLNSKNFRPLHGLIHQRDGVWILQDLWGRCELELERDGDQDLEWGGCRFRILDGPALLNAHQSFLSDHFKREMSCRSETEMEEVIQSLSKLHFFSGPIPNELKDFLTREWSELKLKGPVEKLLSDTEVSDILCLSDQEIWVEKSGQLERSKLQFSKRESYQLYIENLLNRYSQVFDEKNPSVEFEIMEPRARCHVLGPPLTQGELYLSIRKHFVSPLKLEELMTKGMFDREMLKCLQSYLERRKSILVCGATGSGKTTLLGALVGNLNPIERLIVMEDVPELQRGRVNTCYLQTSSDRGLRALVKDSLRMRPDRILIGEVRGSEAWDMLLALNTGHRGSLTSLHANSARDALWRFYCLVQLASPGLGEQELMELISRNIDVVIFCEKDASNQRRIAEVSELKGREGRQFLLSRVFGGFERDRAA
ncbi:MAG: CpaF family protein [Bradymonadales bacterium]|nr:MAG: CpaF family protein [Bradymonadales bacterium]